VTIQAIETSYTGHRFRSRLEARWAVFFDALNLRWDYEPEGVETPAGRYLPDFMLHLPGRRLLFEVKPENEAREITDDRWNYAAAYFGVPLIVAYGMPRPDRLNPADGPPNGHLQLIEENSWDNYHAFCVCGCCGAIGIEHEGRGARICLRGAVGAGRSCGNAGINNKGQSYDAPAIAKAYTAARSARFERGEQARGRRRRDSMPPLLAFKPTFAPPNVLPR
jgi:hypothetical protein